MANRLGDIFGTEDDKENCPFYFKIGACRHGDKCIRIHNKPTISETLLIKNMYKNPKVSLAIAEGQKVSEEGLKQAIRHFEDFYENVFLEFTKFGCIEDMYVLDNLGDHLIGNVYIKFHREEDAEKALNALQGKYFEGAPLMIEYSPVTDFRDSRCKQYDDGTCTRFGYCNFMHLKYISRKFKSSLIEQMFYENPQFKKQIKDHKRKRERSRSSDYSDLGDFSSPKRRRIIASWNKRSSKDMVTLEKNKDKALDIIRDYLKTKFSANIDDKKERTKKR